MVSVEEAPLLMTVNSADALVAAVRSKAPGDKVTLTYEDASGASQTADVTLGASSALAFWPMFTAIAILIGEWGTRASR